MITIRVDSSGRIVDKLEYGDSNEIITLESIPARTDADGTLGENQYWELRYIDGGLKWTKQTREKNVFEKNLETVELLSQQVKALSDQNDFQEELIVELANIVYA